MKINLVLRVGVIFLIIGLSLGIAAIPRSDAQITSGTESPPIPPYGEVSLSFFFPPRDIRLEIECSSPINFYLFDSKGFKAYNESGVLNPIFCFENESRGMYFISLPKRDIYYMVFQNLTNETTYVMLTIFIFGFEKDLLWTSVYFMVFGIVLVVLGLINIGKLFTSYSQKSTLRRSQN